MLQLAHSSGHSSGTRRGEASLLPQMDVLSLVRLGYKQWPLIVGSIVIMLVIGGIYVSTATRYYSASVFILVDTSKNSLMNKQDMAVDRTLDPGLVDSQVEILKSDSVTFTVVRNLGLIDNADFTAGDGGLISTVVGFIGSLGRSEGPPSREEVERAAADKLVDNMKVKRIGQTYVIEVDYSSRNAALAAQIANGISDAYTVSELEARYQSSRRAGQWLQDRIKELREQASAADLAVQKFKAENNIVDTARGLMSEQQLADANSQLVTAHATTAEAKARLDRILEVRNGDIVNATVADALKSEIIMRLRAQYLDLAAKKADLSSRYGKDHGAVVNLQNQMNEISRAAHEELGRVAEGSQSDYKIALAREEALRASMKTLVAQAGDTNKAQVALRNLESSAQTFRNLYDSFLQKFEEATHIESFPVSNARIITPASVPSKPSSPKIMLILAACIVLGGMIGAALALFREVFGNVFRSADDIRDYAGVECLGIMPRLSRQAKTTKAFWRSEADADVLGGSTPIVRHSVLAPFSRFTETVRNIKVSVDIARGPTGCSITGIISSVPSEGKTTLAANLALLTAQMGHRTLLIDGDMHNPSSTRVLRPDAKLGLIDVLGGRCSVADALKRDVITGLEFLPTVLTTRHSNTVALMTSQTMADLLMRAKGTYEYIFIDLPPIVPVVDVKASSYLFDNFIFVVEWGRTSRDVVREAMITAEQIRNRVVGAVLSKADPSELKRAESYRGSSYGSYYTDSDAA